MDGPLSDGGIERSGIFLIWADRPIMLNSVLEFYVEAPILKFCLHNNKNNMPTNASVLRLAESENGDLKRRGTQSTCNCGEEFHPTELYKN